MDCGASKSYWTVRRGIREAVSKHLQDLSETSFDNDIHGISPCSMHQQCASAVDQAIEEDVLVADIRPESAAGSATPVYVTGSSSPVPQFDLLDDDDYVSSSDDDFQPVQIGLPEKLADWARTYRIHLNALSALLNILQVAHPYLPRDARTLLGTLTVHNIETVAGGEYYHFGLESSLVRQLSTIPFAEESCISVQLNIDGLPLFKSSGIQFWPVLGMIDCEYKSSPFAIGVFCGNCKPTSLSGYLQKFVEECQNLKKNGFVVNGAHYSFRISAVICDAPARAFVKGVKGYGGYEGCDKCKQHGVWRGKITYPETTAELRKDQDFYCHQGSYQHEVSPFTTVNIGLVSQFPIDYMHQCCLGVTRRILRLLTKGPLSIRLGPRDVLGISDWLVSIKGFIPIEFSRKPRPLRELDRWKATELRFFMLYGGPVILKKYVPKAVYDNFMLFSTVMHILLSPKFSVQAEMVDYAEQLSKCFVTHFGEVYGDDNLVYNIHSTIHLANDVRLFGNLDKVSSFPFENYLGWIKRLIRKPAQPLQQLVRRLSEQSDVLTQETVKYHDSLRKPHNSGPVPTDLLGAGQYKELCHGKIVLSVAPGDNCVAINGRVVCLQNILSLGSQIIVVYKTFCKELSLFTYPCDSISLGIKVVSDLEVCCNTCLLSEISSKCVMLPYFHDGHYVTFPMLHTNN